MSSAYTVMWNAHRVKIAKEHGFPGGRIPFLFGGPHSSQPDFVRAGVTPGDTIYPVYVKDGIVRVLAKVVAQRFLSLEQFQQTHPEYAAYEPHGCGAGGGDTAVELRHPWLRALYWTCAEHVILAESSSPVVFQKRLPSAMLERLTYASQKAVRRLRDIEDGLLKSITGIQGIYRLAPSSAADFASLFPSLD